MVECGFIGDYNIGELISRGSFVHLKTRSFVHSPCGPTACRFGGVAVGSVVIGGCRCGSEVGYQFDLVKGGRSQAGTAATGCRVCMRCVGSCQKKFDYHQPGLK